MRQYLILYFTMRMECLNWRECFNILLTLDATYEEQRACETIFDNYHENKRIIQEVENVGSDEGVQQIN